MLDLTSYLHVPDYNYCGLNTKNNGKPPVNAIDAACQEHDREYARLGESAYSEFNNADEKLIRAVSKNAYLDPGVAAVVVGFFELKKYSYDIYYHIISLFSNHKEKTMGITNALERNHNEAWSRNKKRKGAARQLQQDGYNQIAKWQKTGHLGDMAWYQNDKYYQGLPGIPDDDDPFGKMEEDDDLDSNEVHATDAIMGYKYLAKKKLKPKYRNLNRNYRKRKRRKGSFRKYQSYGKKTKKTIWK